MASCAWARPPAAVTSTLSLTPTSGGRLPGAGAEAGEQGTGPGMEEVTLYRILGLEDGGGTLINFYNPHPICLQRTPQSRHCGQNIFVAYILSTGVKRNTKHLKYRFLSIHLRRTLLIPADVTLVAGGEARRCLESESSQLKQLTSTRPGPRTQLPASLSTEFPQNGAKL